MSKATRENKPVHGFLYKNSLTLVFMLLFILTLIAQAYFGWQEHNENLQDNGSQEISFPGYLQSGHFIQATFENWESEFLQMALLLF
ncbi:MAG: DUF6766 family protein [Chitinophagaceae bacterium]